MGGLLQLPPAPRSPRWADSLRAALGKERACQRVTEVLRPYTTFDLHGATSLTNASTSISIRLSIRPSLLGLAISLPEQGPLFASSRAVLQLQKVFSRPLTPPLIFVTPFAMRPDPDAYGSERPMSCL